MNAFFTVDADCDKAWPSEGNASVTKGKSKAEYSYSGKGLVALVELTNKLDIPATFFFEARTALELGKDYDLKKLMAGHEVASHGFEHEDFTLLDLSEKTKRLAASKRVLEKIFCQKIEGFRAPYLKADVEVMKALKEEGFKWDSSCFVKESVLPQVIALKELYFWPVIEGKTSEKEFLERISKVKTPVLSTHSWHAAVDLRGSERKPVEEESVLKNMLQQGFTFSRVGSAAKRFLV